MGKIKTTFLKIGNRLGFAFSSFTFSLAFAFMLAGLSIWMVYASPDTNQRLWSSLRITFLASSIFGIGVSVLMRKLFDGKKHQLFSGIVTISFALLSFVSLFIYKGNENFSSTRVIVFVFGLAIISFLFFLVIPTYKSSSLDYNKMFFLTIKSFFISLLYSAVLFAGFAFVALAVKTLLWSDLDNNIYMYILILSLLTGYTFFLGYFPDFQKEESKEFIDRTNLIVKQPRFTEILFQNIMIPIIGALSIVLFIWNFRIILIKDWPEPNQIISIFTIYSLSAIVLYLLVSSYDNLIVRLYKRIIPIATLVFLGFEVYPIYMKISEKGITPSEYSIIILWIFAAIISTIFIFISIKKNVLVSYIGSALVLMLMLPGIGIMDVSYYSQTNRLKSTLEENKMLYENKITANSNISERDKIVITESVRYVFDDNGKTNPNWLENNIKSLEEFRKVFGFNELYYYDPGIKPPNGNDKFYFINAKDEPINIKGYDHYISRASFYNEDEYIIEEDGDKYIIKYTLESDKERIPKIRIIKDETVILDVDFHTKLTEIFEKNFSMTDNLSGKENNITIGLKNFYVDASSNSVSVRVILEHLEIHQLENEPLSFNIEVRAILFKVS